jgi:hypothetical protein
MVNLEKLLPILSAATLLSAVLMTPGCSNTQAKQTARTGKKVEETNELVSARKGDECLRVFFVR